jgi:ketosteroid isomerase-like protein
MSDTRRTFVAANGASLAASACAATENNSPSVSAVPENAVEGLIERSRISNTALMRGDIDSYRSLVAYTDDFTLMSPFGGAPTHGRDMTDETFRRMGRFFRNGTFAQEVVQSYGADDMVVLALIERCNAEVGGLPAQEWPLRVTLVYRREGSEWRPAHRHADPLVLGVSHATAAAIARGDIR